MLPSYQQRMRPVLEATKDGELKYSDGKLSIVEMLGLTEEEISRLNPCGNQSIISNMAVWSCIHMYFSGILFE